MSRLGPVLHRLRAHAAPPSAQSVEKLSLRLSIVAIAGVVALVLIYTAPPSRPKRDVHIEILRTKPAPVTAPRQAHEPSGSTN